MRKFRILLIVVTGGLHVTFAVTMEAALRWLGAPMPWGFAVLAAALLGAAFLGRMELLAADRPVHRLRRLLIEEPYFVHWCALLMAAPLWVGGSALAMMASLVADARLIPRTGSIAAFSYGIGLLTAAWGVFVRRRWVRVRTVDVGIRGLPNAFEGYRIAHLSDLHIGSMCPREHAEKWVRTVGTLDVDLVALTGDYVTGGDAFHEVVAELSGSLPSRDGVIAVMGNHDYFGDGEGLVKKLRARGVEVLRNERTTIERGSARLSVAGVDDTWSRRADMKKALGEKDEKGERDEKSEGKEKGPILVLAHDPQLFPALCALGASLVLSGHTHWGQVAVPFFSTRYNLSSRVYRYNANLYREGDGTLYVSPGLGTTGPPIRLGAAPEITVIRLNGQQEMG